MKNEGGNDYKVKKRIPKCPFGLSQRSEVMLILTQQQLSDVLQAGAVVQCETVSVSFSRITLNCGTP